MSNPNIKPSDMFYDIESLHNIFTLAFYVPHKKAFYIVIHSDLYPDGIVPEADQPIILDKIYEVNKHQFEKQNIEQQHLKIMTLNQFAGLMLSKISSNKAPRMFGWNSRNYDAPLISYILFKYDRACALTKESNKDKTHYFNQLDEPVMTAKEIRQFSDQLINNKRVVDAFENNYEAKSYYYNLKNQHMFVDVQVLNELMQHESLKRVSAQLGLKILESDKLSGANAYVEDVHDIADLSAYNYVDTLNMYVIFLTDPYFGPFNQKSDIIRRFDKKYQGQLGPDTTSASLVEHMIIPIKNKNPWDQSEKLKDNDVISFFYPTRYDNNESLVQLEKECTQMKNDLLEDNVLSIDSKRKINNHIINKLNLKPQAPRYRYNDKTEQLEEDLLEMAINEYQLPQEVYDFYAMFRNKPNINQVKTDIENHNLEYIDDENPTKAPLYTDRLSLTTFVRDSNSYLTFSSGGIHGEYVDQDAFWKNFQLELNKRLENEKFNDTLKRIQNVYGTTDTAAQSFRNTKKNGGLDPSLQDLDGDQFKYATYSKAKGYRWKKEKKVKSITTIIQGPKKGNKKTSSIKSFAKTVDATNVGHDDIDSMYPSLLKALRVFERVVNGHLIDDFGTMLDERLALKYKLEGLSEKGITWTKENIEENKLQKQNKLFLNSASGKADGNFDNKIKVNNKMLSARLNGQLILAYLVYKITDKGGLCVSSNTDGVYYTGISNEEVSKINDEWCYYFRMSAKPETIHKFISKSANDRIEIMDPQGKNVKPAGASILAHKGYNIIKKASKPNIVDNMLVKYFKDYNHPLEKFDKSYLRQYLSNMIQASKQHPDKFLNKTLNLFQWCMKDGLGSNQYYLPINLDNMHVYDKSHTKRFFLVKDSDYVLAKYVVNKEMKTDDKTIRNLLVELGFITNDTPGNANKKKPSYLSDDFSQNKIEMHQEDLDEIDISILDRLDIDKYIDIAEEVWLTWSSNYVEIYQ